MKQEQSLAFQSRGLDKRTTALVTDDPSAVLPAKWPTHIPLVRITTCGRLDVTVLHALTTDAAGAPQGVYGPLDGHQRAEKGSATALRLLCLLASQSRGFASRDLISEKLRRFSPEGDGEDDEPDGLKRVDNVVSRLRRLLLPPLFKVLPEAMPVRQRLVTFHRATSESGPGYQLCGLPLIWLDVQVIHDAAKRARRLTQFGQDSTAEWQTVYELAASGPFLKEEVYSDWPVVRRQEVETQWWDAVQMLTRQYTEQGEAGEREAMRLLRDYWMQHVTNEDALRPLLEQLAKREGFGQAEAYYAQLCRALEQEGRQPDRRTQETMEFVHAVNIQRKRDTHIRDRERTNLNATELSPIQQDMTWPFSHTIVQGIMEAGQTLENQSLLLQSSFPQEKIGPQTIESNDASVKRREATRTIGALGLQLLGLPVWEQISHMLMASSSLDKATLKTLETMTENFWSLSETTVPSLLINPVVGHFEMMTQFLRSAPPPSFYQPLCSLTAEIAQIAARLFFDMKGYKQSMNCYALSIELAHRAQNQVLEVVGLTRYARDMLQNGYTQEASAFLQQAPQLSSQPGASIASAYLAAVRAKVLSRQNETEACRQNLDEATQFVAQIQPGEDRYFTSFDASLLNDFQGDCYLQLRNFSEAQAVFQEALNLSDFSSLRHRASITIGLADTLIQLGELEQSCLLAQNALEFTAQTQSWMTFQYILTFRKRLEIWKNEPCVKYLDEQITNVSPKIYRLDQSATSSSPYRWQF